MNKMSGKAQNSPKGCLSRHFSRESKRGVSKRFPVSETIPSNDLSPIASDSCWEDTRQLLVSDISRECDDYWVKRRITAGKHGRLALKPVSKGTTVVTGYEV